MSIILASFFLPPPLLVLSILAGVLLVIAGVIGLLVYGAKLARHKIRQHGLSHTEPRCPTCRYIIKGVVSTTCPECGGDITQGLLVPTPPPRPPSWPLVCVAYGIFYIFVMPYVYLNLGLHIPRFTRVSQSISLNAYPVGGTKAARLGESVQIEIDGTAKEVRFIAIHVFRYTETSGKDAWVVILPNEGRYCAYDTPRAWEDYGSTIVEAYQSILGEGGADWHAKNYRQSYDEKTLAGFIDKLYPERDSESRHGYATDLQRLVDAVKSPQRNLGSFKFRGFNEVRREEHRSMINTYGYNLLLLSIMLTAFAAWPLTAVAQRFIEKVRTAPASR